ncbi:uncharacterized protein LOC132255373 [Phlebotomus argentipes]|uniref:uncharacterized protein LOC132255373 n=1 Tax=Phlebotomus argentipes TaxID=94469 RepID=UPI002892FF94|nr:uncharacterized protein LOC132255373 [Phlebotomus argentipes]
MPNFRPKRKSEMWMSHNRVLIGGNKKSHARNPNFETEETKLLISLWGDPKVQKTLITTHKKHPVIAKLAESMRTYGYYRSPTEINTRLKNLKCFYNRIKKDMEMGVINQPTWKHYDAMDEILNRPIFGSRLTMQQQQRQHQILHEEATKNLRSEDVPHVEQEELIVPKEEPLDIDDSDVNELDLEDSADSFPSQLAAYLRVQPKNSNAHTSDSQDSGSGEPLIAPEDIKKSPPPSPPPKQVSTSAGPRIIAPKPASTPTSKISLVPTNILLKPQAQKVALKPAHTIYMKNPTTGAVSAIPSVASSTSGMPMKVLLVNTMPKSTVSTPTIISKATPTICHTPAMTASQECRPAPINYRRMSATRPPKPSTIGFRTLLSQVIQQQTLSLEVARERLAVEKERLAFERATGEKLLEVLPLLQSMADHLTGRRTSQRLRKPANSISHDSDE